MTFDWKKACIEPQCTILEALQVINQSASRAAFVVAPDGKFCGLVTDGDIRRGLLSNISLEQSVGQVMNSSPLTCHPGDSLESVQRIMEAKQLLHMPVVQDHQLVNVFLLQDLIEPPKRENPVFLMAGGYGTRLQPLTENCPKPLLRVGQKPILETILESFARCGFYRFYISTHYLPEMVQEYFEDGSRWGVQIQYTYEEEPLGTGGALGLLPDDLPELPLLMMNGDILTRVNFGSLLDYHVQAEAMATMCVREHEYQVPYGVVSGEDFNIKHIVEKPIYRHYINAGIYVINPEVIQQVKALQRVDMPDLISKQIADGYQVSMYPLDEYWLDIGRMNDFEQAQQDVLNLFKS